MGQYYKPIILTRNDNVKKWWYSHDHDNGLKLMEHSYIGNNFVAEVEKYLFRNPQKLVWAGDYADEEADGNTLYSKCKENKTYQKESLPWPGWFDPQFIINHFRREFVDLSKCPWIYNGWGRIHPLPLLTCEGNGRGGGDFRGEDKYVGTWARDRIEVSSLEPENYEELIPNFIEE